MSTDRFISFQFCDDIRHEVNGKFSLIGCYGTALLLSPIPTALSKLCAVIKVFTPIDRPFAKLAVRIMRGDTLLGEVPFTGEALVVRPPPGTFEGARWFHLVAMIVLSPLVVEAPCTLRVEVETEEGILAGGCFWIMAPPAPDAKPAPAP